MQPAREAEMQRLRQADKPLEGVYPETMLPPGRLMKGLQGAAAGLAGRFRGPQLNTVQAPMTPRLPGPTRPRELEGPTAQPRLPGPTRPRELDGPRAPSSKGSRSARERSEEEERMQGEGGRYKRGGKVKAYAKGGAVTASRRADGIAQRGKTRGRVV